MLDKMSKLCRELATVEVNVEGNRGALITTLKKSDKYINTLASGWFWRFSQKNSSFRLPYQRLSSSAD